MVTVIVLTYNEEIHLERCLNTIVDISNQIIIVDSFSNDKTLEIGFKFDAEIFQRKFINQADQFQWALDNCNIKNNWILRLDADEFLTKELAKEIEVKIPQLSNNINGVILKRRLYFFDKWIKYGGIYPVKILRLFKKGKAVVDSRYMDEHIILNEGEVYEMENDFVDQNLKNFSYWIDKHNDYAIREAYEALNSKYQFCIRNESISSKKKTLYYKIPIFWRSYLYFFIRYFLKLGFLDGKQGLIWHFFQGLWYRYLVDIKIYEIERKANYRRESFINIFKEEYKLEV